MRGAKFMQSGVDIGKGADYEVAFTSEWPVMKVVTSRLQRTTLYTNSSANLVSNNFYKHGLGYTPMFLPYRYNASARTYEFFRTIMTADNNYIHWYLSGGSPAPDSSFDVVVGLQIFAINLREDYESKTNNPSPLAIGSSGKSYGMQFVPDGKNVSTATKESFLMDTIARTPQIHAVSYGEALTPASPSGYNYSYTHNLPYKPMYFVYGEDLSWPSELQIRNNFDGITVVNNTITVNSPTQGDRISIVVLKDPFDVSDNSIVMRI